MGNLELVLFESDATGATRIVGRVSDPEFIRCVRLQVLEDRRAEVARLECDGDVPHLRVVPDLSPKRGPVEVGDGG